MPVYQRKNKNGRPIYNKRGDSWYFRCQYTTLGSEKKQHNSGCFQSKQDAIKAEADFLNKQGKVPKTYKSITIGEALDEYKVSLASSVKEQTLHTYDEHNKYFESIKDIQVIDFNIYLFNKWKMELEQSPTIKATNYKNQIIGHLKSSLKYVAEMYNYPISESILKMNPFKFNDKEKSKEMLIWTVDEFGLFIKQEEDIRYKAFFITLFFTGVRTQEANALQWKDIDFNNDTISVNKNLNRHNEITTTKTYATRKLPMSDTVKTALIQLKNYYSTLDGFNDDFFVFGGISPLSQRTITSRKNKACEKANVKQIRLHDMRHSFASYMINNDVPMIVISNYLGHKNLKYTLNIYSHLYPSSLGSVRDFLNTQNHNYI